MMLSLGLDPDLERVLERDVDDLARYNILRFLHDHPGFEGDATIFAEKLGLRPESRAAEALDGLSRAGFLSESSGTGGPVYRLTTDPASLRLVVRLCALSASDHYGQLVERLAARSLHRARRFHGPPRVERRNGNGH